MWNFLSVDPSDLGGFVFYLFDSKHIGKLDFVEMKKVLEAIHGIDLNSKGQLQDQIMQELQSKSAIFTVDSFQNWTRIKPMLINPVLTTQFKLQEDIIANSFWKKISTQRMQDVNKNRRNFVHGLCSTVHAVYEERNIQAEAMQRISDMKGELQTKKSKSVDDRSSRRSTVLIDKLNQTEAKSTKHKRETKVASFNVEKYREDAVEEFKVPKASPKKRRKSTLRNHHDVVNKDPCSTEKLTVCKSSSDLDKAVIGSGGTSRRFSSVGNMNALNNGIEHKTDRPDSSIPANSTAGKRLPPINALARKPSSRRICASEH